jgi:MFS family permease
MSRNVVHLAIGFLLIFIGFGSIANIIAKSLSDQGFTGLGLYSLGIIYGAFALFSILTSGMIIERFGTKVSIVGAAVTYMLYCVCGLVPILGEEASKTSEVF